MNQTRYKQGSYCNTIAINSPQSPRPHNRVIKRTLTTSRTKPFKSILRIFNIFITPLTSEVQLIRFIAYFQPFIAHIGTLYQYLYTKTVNIQSHNVYKATYLTSVKQISQQYNLSTTLHIASHPTPFLNHPLFIGEFPKPNQSRNNNDDIYNIYTEGIFFSSFRQYRFGTILEK